MGKPKRKGSTAAVIEAHIGAQIRELRITRGLSQLQLAKIIGVTYQQQQKYENGTNTISAGILFEVALALNAPLSFFYEGVGAEVVRVTTPHKRLLLEITRSFSAIKEEEYQRAICELARLMARR